MKEFGIEELAKKYGTEPSDQERDQATAFIGETIYTQGGMLAIPEPTSERFSWVDAEMEEAKKVLDQVSQAIVSDGEPPEVYVKAVENIGFPENMVKFPLRPFLDEVIPQIREKGIADYFVTDSRRVTVVFHHDGIVYWNKAV